MESSQFSVNWSSYHSNLSHGFSLLQQREEFVDMTLAADGHFVKVHRSLVCLVSPFIKQLVLSMPGPAQYPVIFLDISYDMLCYILEYMYKGELLVPNVKFEKFLTCAKKLHIKGLENLNKGNKTETENVHTDLENNLQDSPDKPKNYPDPQNSKQCFTVEQKYMPVYQKHVQADQKHVTINLDHKQADHKHLSINQRLVATDQEHVLADKQFQPDNTENIIADKELLQANQEYVPPDQQHVPPNRQHVPLNQQHVTLNQQHVPLNQQHVPLNQQHVPLIQQLVPAEQQLVPPKQQHTQVNQQHAPLDQQYVPLDQQHMPVKQQLVQADQQYAPHKPIDQEHVLAEEQHVPPNQQNTLVNQQHASLDLQHVSVSQQLVQADQQHEPVDQEHVLDDQQHVPAIKNNVTMNHEHVQADQELVPAVKQVPDIENIMTMNQGHVQTDDEFVSGEQECVPIDQELMPANPPLMPSDQQDLPPDQQPMSSNQQHVPVNDIDVTKKAMDDIMSMDDTKVKRRSIRILEEKVYFGENKAENSKTKTRKEKKRKLEKPDKLVIVSAKKPKTSAEILKAAAAAAKQQAKNTPGTLCIKEDMEKIKPASAFQKAFQDAIAKNYLANITNDILCPENNFHESETISGIIENAQTVTQPYTQNIMDMDFHPLPDQQGITLEFIQDGCQNFTDINNDENLTKKTGTYLDTVQQIDESIDQNFQPTRAITKLEIIAHQAQNATKMDFSSNHGTQDFIDTNFRPNHQGITLEVIQDGCQNFTVINNDVNLTNKTGTYLDTVQQIESLSQNFPSTRAITELEIIAQNAAKTDFSSNQRTQDFIGTNFRPYHQGITLEVIKDGCQNFTAINNDLNPTNQTDTILDTVQQYDESLNQNHQPSRVTTKLEIIAQQAQNSNKMDISSNQRTQDFIDTNFRPDHQGITLEVIKDGCQNFTAINNDLNPTNQTDTILDTVQQYDESLNQNHQPSRVTTKLEIIAQQAQNANKMDISSNQRTQDFIDTNFRPDHQGITLEVIQDGCQNFTAINNDLNPTNQTDTNLDTVQQFDESINQNHQPTRATTKLEIIAQQAQNATKMDFSSNQTQDFIDITIELLRTEEGCNIDETSLDSYSMLDTPGEDLRDLLQTQENSDLVQTFGTQHTMNMPDIDLQIPSVSNIQQNMVLRSQVRKQVCKTQAANSQEILTVAQTNMQVRPISSIADSIVTEKSGKYRKNTNIPLPKQDRGARNIHELLQQTQESIMADECIPQDHENPSKVPQMSEHSCTTVEQSNMPHIDLTNADIGCSNGMQFTVVDSSKDLPDMRLYTVSNKGTLQLILNRYLYCSQNKGRATMKHRWRCVEYKGGCKAYVVIFNDDTIKRAHEHCHNFHDDRIYKKMQQNLVYTSIERASSKSYSRKCVADALFDSDEDY